MTRAAERKPRRTVSRRTIAAMCEQAKASGMTARIRFPDGVVLELTPASEEGQVPAGPDPFAGFQ